MESGVHFGHRSSRWNPKMKPFIFMKRNLVHIIDLRETIRSMVLAARYLTYITSKGGEVLFVGTKRQARSVVQNQARRSGMHFVSERWLGGSLTNFSVIRNRLKRLEYLEELENSNRIRMYSKKMQSSILRTKAKMLRNLSGIRKMARLPGVLVIIDPGREKNALREANRLGIPTIAVIDTDCNPESVDIPIPANDDAMRSIAVIMETLGDAVVQGVEKYKTHVGPLPDRAGPADGRGGRRRSGFRDRGRGGARPGTRGPGRGDKPPAGRGAATPAKPTPVAEKPAPVAEKTEPAAESPAPPAAAPPEEASPETQAEKPPEPAPPEAPAAASAEEESKPAPPAEEAGDDASKREEP
ncbi:MAG: 30S ribosomal protein S2 [Planctomycetota bacterium]|jgi:small subunit ribosomal protein S2